MLEQTENIYQKILESLSDSSQGAVLQTQISAEKRGSISELKRNLTTAVDPEDMQAAKILLSGKPQMIDTGAGQLFTEPFFRKERMLIFGGGHIAIPLIALAKMTGFFAAVADDREEFANKNRFPEADEVYCGSFSDCIRRMNPAAGDYCVIITRGHSQDTQCIRELFRYEEPVYTGMIGSRKRTGTVLLKLEEEGLDSDRLARICTPIGISIGAKTVEEIAVSIIAEVIKRKRLESLGQVRIDRSDGDRKVIEALAEIHSPCALATVMKAEGSVPRAAGAKMIVFLDGSICGSIGGGGVEAAVIERALKLIGTGTYEVLDVDLNGADAMAEGMVCGGNLSILLEDFR